MRRRASQREASAEIWVGSRRTGQDEILVPLKREDSPNGLLVALQSVGKLKVLPNHGRSAKRRKSALGDRNSRHPSWSSLVPTSTDDRLAVFRSGQSAHVGFMTDQHVARSERSLGGSEGGGERPDVDKLVLSSRDEEACWSIMRSASESE